MLSKKTKSLALFLILSVFLVSSFQNCADSAVQFEKIASSQQRSVKLDANSMENNQTVKVLFVIDDSNSMAPAQDKLKQKIAQLVDGLANLDIEFGAISTNMSSIEMKAITSTDKTINESPTGYTKTYSSTNRAYVKMTTPTSVKIAKDISLSEKNLKIQEVLKMTQIGVNISGNYDNEYEYGLCNLGIFLQDDRPTSFIKNGDKVAIILLTNEDDFSHIDYDSTSSNKALINDCPFSYNRSGYSDYSIGSQSSTSVHVIDEVRATFTDDGINPITKRVDSSSTKIELYSMTPFSPSETISSSDTMTFGALAIAQPSYNLCGNSKLRARLLDAFSREYGYNPSAISILSCQTGHSSHKEYFNRKDYEEPCTQSYKGSRNILEYVQSQGYWMSSSGFCLTSHGSTRWVGGSDRMTQVVHFKDLYPKMTSYTDIINEQVKSKIGVGSLYFAAIVSENSQYTRCSPLSSQNKYRQLTDTLNRHENTADIFSLCDDDYSEIMKNISKYTQKLVSNSYRISYNSETEKLSQVIVRRNNQVVSELVEEIDYSIKGQTLTFKKYVPDSRDQYELIFQMKDEEY